MAKQSSRTVVNSANHSANLVANPSNNPAAQEKIEQFRQELDQKLDQAIDHHEFKMVYIGIATLALFVGVIYAAWKF